MALISSTGGPFTRHDPAGRCPVCGVKNAACGGPTSHVPIDIPTEQQQEARMAGPLRIYHVNVAGRKVLFRLNQTDAQRLGGTPAPGTDATSATDQTGQTEEKSRQPPNKARTPANKSPGNPQPGHG